MLLDYNNDRLYAGLDRFGRLVELRWQNTTLSSLVDRYGYGYDRNGNRTFRDNLTSAAKDEVYTYDGLDQLRNMDRGNMVYPLTNPPTVQESPPLVERDFIFDATGNWKGYVEKTSGTTGLNQSRTHNTANEIGVIGASTGPTGPTPPTTAWATWSRGRSRPAWPIRAPSSTMPGTGWSRCATAERW